MFKPLQKGQFCVSSLCIIYQPLSYPFNKENFGYQNNLPPNIPFFPGVIETQKSGTKSAIQNKKQQTAHNDQILCKNFYNFKKQNIIGGVLFF